MFSLPPIKNLFSRLDGFAIDGNPEGRTTGGYTFKAEEHPRSEGGRFGENGGPKPYVKKGTGEVTEKSEDRVKNYKPRVTLYQKGSFAEQQGANEALNSVIRGEKSQEFIKAQHKLEDEINEFYTENIESLDEEYRIKAEKELEDHYRWQIEELLRSEKNGKKLTWNKPQLAYEFGNIKSSTARAKLYSKSPLSSKELESCFNSSPLTEKEEEAIRDWTGLEGGSHIQDYLLCKANGQDRRLKKISERWEGRSLEEIEEDVSSLDRLISNSTVINELEVYRGINELEHTPDLLEEEGGVSRELAKSSKIYINSFLNSKPGDVVKSSTYTATSPSTKTLKEYSRGPTSVALVIKLPKGSRAAIIDNDEDEFMQQREILISRNARFQIESVDKKSRTVHVKLLGGEE